MSTAASGVHPTQHRCSDTVATIEYMEEQYDTMDGEKDDSGL